MIDRAALGDTTQQKEFAARYYPVVAAYMGARWRGSRLFSDVEDASQEVFTECFSENGPLTRADRAKMGGFRAFLYGIARNVARRVEERHFRRANVEKQANLELVCADESSLSHAFDRAWAVQVITAARTRQSELAELAGEDAVQRVNLLRLRFREGKPIRDIAKLWEVDADYLHREFRKARREFLQALRDVVKGENVAASAAEIEQQCRELLALLR